MNACRYALLLQKLHDVLVPVLIAVYLVLLLQRPCERISGYSHDGPLAHVEGLLQEEPVALVHHVEGPPH